ncbi:TPA: ead/Ea22-like family protein [Klebsiella variicola]|nr:ead/Ea22-like family protein [Klebsiella variicola]HDK6721152.1 ead/Ea22-like family protein [Klebsiella variicola]
MTDITELAQSLKAAAEKATPGPWERGDGRHGGELFVYCDDALGSAVCEATSTYNAIPKYQRIHNLDFIAIANPANVLALVEALEKAQRMEAYWKTQCRGITDHCEELQARIAELESRTVKLPELCVGVVQDGHAVMVPYPAGHWFNKTAILEMLADAGIKVEVE